MSTLRRITGTNARLVLSHHLAVIIAGIFVFYWVSAAMFNAGGQ
jgi:hypothetical protein